MVSISKRKAAAAVAAVGTDAPCGGPVGVCDVGGGEAAAYGDGDGEGGVSTTMIEGIGDAMPAFARLFMYAGGVLLKTVITA